MSAAFERELLAQPAAISELTDAIMDYLAAEGVDTRGVATDPQGHTAVYFVSHRPQGHVFSYLRAGSAASRTRPEYLPLDLVRSARFVHASGIGMAISSSACDAVLAAFDAGRSAGAKISFD